MPLALLFAAMVVYASLYPFEGWRWPGGSLLGFFSAPLSRYWSWFDVLATLVGYIPPGFLLALGLSRSGWGRWAWIMAAAGPAVLSLAMESLQNFLPMRVPSNLDLLLNALGASLGAGGAWCMDRLGVLHRWTQFRRDWFRPHAHGGLVLVALWPFSLLYPASVPFGLGQVWERLEALLVEVLSGTPFLRWVPMRVDSAEALGPLAQALCVALGLLAPLLTGYADVRTAPRRLVFLVMVLSAGLAAAGLSSALTYGPEHAWAWVDAPTLLGLGLAAVAGLAALALPPRGCHVGLILALAVSLSLLNRVPSSAYLDQSLEVWEQGRFIRFHGLSQWLGWLWPFAALVFGVRAAIRSPAVRGPGH